ncbi:thromboxane-A synthase [Trichonephila clavipes]|nr:thromboxane-A synthase [Trichonephila clavipes]
MTGHIYRDVILEQHVRLFRGAMGAEFLFMDDNACPHRANIVDECLQSEDITHMDWPAYSQDLNPIKHTGMEVFLTFLVVLTGSIGFVIVRWIINRHQRLKLLKHYGIPGPEPSFLSGNMNMLKSEPTPNDLITSWLKKYGNVFGYYLGEIPYVVVNDLEMLKQMFIKDFNVFTNRQEMHLDVSPLNKTILALKDKRWKEVRSLLTPTFSSGKIKLMTNIVDKKASNIRASFSEVRFTVLKG